MFWKSLQKNILSSSEEMGAVGCYYSSEWESKGRDLYGVALCLPPGSGATRRLTESKRLAKGRGGGGGWGWGGGWPGAGGGGLVCCWFTQGQVPKGNGVLLLHVFFCLLWSNLPVLQNTVLFFSPEAVTPIIKKKKKKIANLYHDISEQNWSNMLLLHKIRLFYFPQWNKMNIF